MEKNIVTAMVTKSDSSNVSGTLDAIYRAAKEGDKDDAKSSTNCLMDTVQQSKICYFIKTYFKKVNNCLYNIIKARLTGYKTFSFFYFSS